jgi:hypothetical protein
MKKTLISFMLLSLLTACNPRVVQDAPAPVIEKINARVLVYLSDEFVHYQYIYDAILSRFSYDFTDSVNSLVPQLFTDLFVKADITYTRMDITDDYDFLVIPEFISANLFTDKVFGNDLLIYVQATFWSKSIMNKIAIKGTGKSSDDGVVSATPDLGRQAFAAAVNDLKKNILKERPLLTTNRQNTP